MDISTQKDRYARLAPKSNAYAVSARLDGRPDVTVTLTGVQAAEALIALGHHACSLSFALGLPGDDTSPVALDGLKQLDNVLDAMSALLSAAAPERVVAA